MLQSQSFVSSIWASNLLWHYGHFELGAGLSQRCSLARLLGFVNSVSRVDKAWLSQPDPRALWPLTGRSIIHCWGLRRVPCGTPGSTSCRLRHWTPAAELSVGIAAVVVVVERSYVSLPPPPSPHHTQLSVSTVSPSCRHKKAPWINEDERGN